MEPGFEEESWLTFSKMRGQIYKHGRKTITFDVFLLLASPRVPLAL